MRWPARWRRLRTFLTDAAILAVLGYLGVFAYLYVYQVDLVFRAPSRGSLLAKSIGLAPERIVVTDDRGLATEAWRVLARRGTPASAGSGVVGYWILFLHGNAASISSSPNVRRYDQLRQLGLNVLAVEYPGFGDVGGTASEAGMHAAARAAYDHLRRVDGVPASHIAIYGWSLGTGAAVPLARDVDETALIVEGGFTSVLARAGEQHPFMPVSWLLKHPFKSDEAIAATHSATLVLHSPDDVIIPFTHGEAMFAKAAEPKRLVRLAGGHIYPNAEDADRYSAAIHDFLQDVAHWPVETPRRSAGVAVAAALARGGIEAALAAWRTALAEGEPRWNLAEYELQYVARQCTLTDRHDAAVALFRANRDRFPDSPLAWYELGQALAAAGQRDDARRALRHSLALEPAAINPSHAARAGRDGWLAVGPLRPDRGPPLARSAAMRGARRAAAPHAGRHHRLSLSVMNFAGKTVIVTGGTQGIGEGCAAVFAAAGASVVIASPDSGRGPGVAAALSQRGPGRVHFTRCDVTADADREGLIAGAIARDGRLDCLVNNAGWHPPHKPIDDFSLDDFRALLELNVVSVFALAKLALPHLRRTRGSIVNVASLVATIGQHHATTYVATKGAVKSFTKALAVDEAVHGVRVNSISPGNVFTPLWQQAIDAAPDPAQCRDDGEMAQWAGRMGTPEEVGRLCLFLASEATFTTGVDHIISGGAEIGYGRKAIAR